VVWDARDALDESVGQLLFSATVDGGHTWSVPSAVTGQPTGAAALYPRVHVPRPGILTLVYQRSGLTESNTVVSDVLSTVSTDRGRTWSAPTRLGQYGPPTPLGTFVENEASGSGYTGFNPQQRTDSNLEDTLSSVRASDGTLFSVWPVVGTRGATQLMMSMSTDGRSWTPARAVTSAASQQALPALAADAHGILGLTYYQYESSGGSGTPWCDVWFSTSSDRGLTWSTQLVAAHFDASADWLNGISDYDDIEARAPGRFVAVFELTRPFAQHGDTDVFAATLGESAGAAGSRPSTGGK
jgi:Neuraminidase (sialidase)